MQSTAVKITNSINRIKHGEITHLNNYRVIKQIGEGPYAKIKLVQDVNDNNKPYAMKKFSLYLLKKKTRMVRDKDGKNKYISVVEDVEVETGLMVPLNHTNVIKIRQVMRTAENQKLYLIMEYCEFGDIAQWNSKKHCFTMRPEILETTKLTKILIGIFKGLLYLHNNDVVHRDLKPGNILIDSSYTPKIIDFGRAVKLKQPSQLLKGSEGTYHFMSPQMLSEKDKQGYDAKKSDVWSLGVTIYCLVTQKLPFYVEPIMKLFEAIDKSEFKYPEKQEIPEHMKRIIDGCIVHEPGKRMGLVEMIGICEEYLKSVK